MSAHLNRIMKGIMIYLFLIFFLFLIMLINSDFSIEFQTITLSTLFNSFIIGLIITGIIVLLVMTRRPHRMIRFTLLFIILISIIYLVIKNIDQFNMQYFILFYLYGIAFILLLISPIHHFFSLPKKEKEPISETGYKFGDYTLYCRDIILAGSKKEQRIYYFCKKKPKTGYPCDKPEGFEIQINKRTGMPYLKRKK